MNFGGKGKAFLSALQAFWFAIIRRRGEKSVQKFAEGPYGASYSTFVSRYFRGEMPFKRLKKRVNEAGSEKCSCSVICAMVWLELRNRNEACQCGDSHR